MGKLWCFHNAGSYCTVLDLTQIFSLVICGFTDIDVWGVYVLGTAKWTPKFLKVTDMGVLGSGGAGGGLGSGGSSSCQQTPSVGPVNITVSLSRRSLKTIL